MKFRLSPTKLAFLKDLEDQAFQQNMDVDYETMTLVPIQGTPRVWPIGDRVPEDYEGGKED